MEYKSTVTILPEGIDKYAAFGEIVRNCDVFDILDDKDRYLEAVIKREKLQSTGIGHSTAIAHGKVPHLKKTTVALGISTDGISYDDIFPEPVHLVFLLASCPTKPSEYVSALGSLLSWVHEEEVREGLVSCDFERPSVKAFLEMLKGEDFHKFTR